MGCAAAKELVENRRGLDEGRGGGRRANDEALADEDPHQAAIRQHAVDQANKRPQVLETYWLAGSVEMANAPPHFVPQRGPATVQEKLPPCPASLRRRIVAALFVPPLHWSTHPQQHVHLNTTVGSANPFAETLNSTTTSAAADGCSPDQTSPLRELCRPLSGMAVITAAALSSKAATLAAGSSSTAASFPIPRWYSCEPQLPAVERVLLDAAEGRLSVYGGTEARSSTHSTHSISGGGGVGGRPPLAHPPPAVAAVPAADPPGMSHGVDSSHGGAAAPLRSHFVLPDDSVVARAFFSASVRNGCSVGWVKLPVGPVQRRQTVSTTAAIGEEVAVIIRNDIAGLEQQQDNQQRPQWAEQQHRHVPPPPLALHRLSTNVTVEDRGGVHSATSPNSSSHGGVSESTVVAGGVAANVRRTHDLGVGYLSADKPFYHVQLDGPVAAPFESADERSTRTSGLQENAIAAPLEPSLPRHLEKYFLYVKNIHAVCITLAWKNAADVEAPFVDVSSMHRLSWSAGGGRGSGGGTAGAAPEHGAAAGSGLLPVTSNGTYFMSLPVDNDPSESDWLRRRLDEANVTVTETTAVYPHRPGVLSALVANPLLHHERCIPALQSFALVTENSLPLYVSVSVAQLHPHLYFTARQLMRQRVMGGVGDHPTASISQSQAATIAASVASLLAGLSHDDVCWMGFRWRFLELLQSASDKVISGIQQQPRHHPLPPPIPHAVHLALRVGVRIQYDNQEFVAYNDFGRNNRARGGYGATATDSHSHDHHLTFVDTSRTPAVETSHLLAESSTLICSLRMRALPPSAMMPVATIAADSGAGRSPVETHADDGEDGSSSHVMSPLRIAALQQELGAMAFQDAAAEELSVLALLFAEFLPGVLVS